MKRVSIAFQTDKSAQEYIRLAKLVNEFDFDAVSVYCDAPFHPSYGPLLLMSPFITRARLGPAAVSPFRIHPIDIAASTALLAQVAGGGVYIGIARGAWLPEHGIIEPARPVEAIREAVEIVQGILSGELRGYQGEHFQIRSLIKTPYPIPNDPIPVLIGTWGPKLASIAGEIADEVKVGGSANPDFVPVMKSYIRSGEEKAGRALDTVGLVMGAVTVVDEDRSRARLLAKQKAALYLPVVAKLDPTVNIDQDLLDLIQKRLDEHDLDAAAGLISDEILDQFAFAGNPGDLIEKAEQLFELGVDRIEFGTPHGILPETGIRMIGEKVLPALKAMT